MLDDRVEGENKEASKPEIETVIKAGLVLFIDSYQRCSTEALQTTVREYIEQGQVQMVDPDILRAEVDSEAYGYINRQVDLGRITRSTSYDLATWYDDEKVKE